MSWFASLIPQDLFFYQPRIFPRGDAKRKEWRENNNASYCRVVICGSVTYPLRSLRLRPVKLTAASSMGWWAMWKGLSVPCADFLLWANRPRQIITQCTRQPQELMWPWMQLWPPSAGCGLFSFSSLLLLFVSVLVHVDFFIFFYKRLAIFTWEKDIFPTCPHQENGVKVRFKSSLLRPIFVFVVRRRPLVAVVDFSSKEGRQAMVHVRNKLSSQVLCAAESHVELF